MSDTPDLPELHRWLAALMNPRCHWDIAQMPDVERLAAVDDVLERISEQVEFERLWQPFLDRSV